MKRKGLFILLIPALWLSTIAHSQDFQVIFEDDVQQTKADSAKLFIQPVADTLRMMIVEKAREYLGVNYKWGYSSENAFDCSGYVKYVYGQFGFMLPHSSYEQFNTSKRLELKKAKPGDLVFFITRGQRISHVGIYIGENHFIHAPRTGKQVQIDSLDEEYFRKHLAGFGTIL
jgi:cell wall-associated NlpC family hydrolase